MENRDASGKEHSTVTVAVASWVAEDWKRFVELPYFRAKWLHLGLNDDDLRALQIGLTVAPTRWPVVGGTGGLRKMRDRIERSLRKERSVDNSRGTKGADKKSDRAITQLGSTKLVRHQ